MGIKCPKCHHENPDDTVYCGKCATPLKSAEEISITKTLITPKESLHKGSSIAGRYHILEELGRGGMGVVYKAKDTKLKRTVALKFLPPELTHIPDIKERFMREAQAAAALDHPNICTVYEFDEAEEKTFISMAYIEGQSLKKKIESGPLELDEAIRIALQVAEGLQKAHKNGVIHRDIKSANIMVTEEDQAKIMDFGLARMAGGTLVTKEGMTMGTIAYMSPEQARGEEVDHRTDIWSLGVVLYEIFSGQLPFKGEQDQAVVYSILKEKPKSITDIRSEIPMSIEQVVGKALEKNPDERYQHVEELIDDLKSISEGIVPEEIKARVRKAKLLKRKRAILYAGIAGILILMTVISISLFTGRTEAIDSIAVLPLENLTGDPEQEYFVDGATDEIIGQLAQISGLRRVISRQSMMRYKDSDKPLPEIARELNVDAVVEGTVYQVGENVRIRVQLIDALPEERNLWAKTYNRAMTDVLVMYSEMARAIAGKIQVKLTAEETTRLTNVRQVNPEAYEAYTQGRLHWNRLTPQDLETALQYFETALQIDPNYALAHAGVAMVWVIRGQFGLVPFSEARSLGKAAAEKALELDNTLAEAHYAFAFVAWREWDWESAETSFQRAIELNPNFPDAPAYYSHLLSIVGREDEALPHSERAIELDPLNALFHGMYAIVLLYHRRYDDAMAAARTALALDPGLSPARSALQDGLIAKGMRDEQLAIQRARIALDPERVAAFERGLEEGGYEGAQRGIADVLAARYQKSGKWVFAAAGIAYRYLDAGDYDRTIDWLEKGYVEGDPSLCYIGMPIWDPLRSFPRFQDLLRKIGLPADEKE